MSRVQTISFAGLMVVAAGSCLALGVWQLDRLAQRRAFNLETERARSAPEVDLAAGHPESLDQRRVIARGQFDRGRAFVLRGLRSG